MFWEHTAAAISFPSPQIILAISNLALPCKELHFVVKSNQKAPNLY